jgi:hypothetical protein
MARSKMKRLIQLVKSGQKCGDILAAVAVAIIEPVLVLIIIIALLMMSTAVQVALAQLRYQLDHLTAVKVVVLLLPWSERGRDSWR